MDINTRLIEINEKLSGNGRQFITSNDVIWLLNTVVEQQKEIERLEAFITNLQDVHFTELQREKATVKRLIKANECLWQAR